MLLSAELMIQRCGTSVSFGIKKGKKKTLNVRIFLLLEIIRNLEFLIFIFVVLFCENKGIAVMKMCYHILFTFECLDGFFFSIRRNVLFELSGILKSRE